MLASRVRTRARSAPYHAFLDPSVLLWEMIRSIGVSEVTYYRWRQEYSAKLPRFPALKVTADLDSGADEPALSRRGWAKQIGLYIWP
jgi:hypothetical protein